jgi:hypothetical protein
MRDKSERFEGVLSCWVNEKRHKHTHKRRERKRERGFFAWDNKSSV